MALIYIVEDDQNIQEIEAYALRGSGYEVNVFSTGEELFLAVKHKKPNLILLDIMLPGEDGLSILKRLRKQGDTCQVPIMMVTAKASEMDTVKGLDMGADDYITKPFGIMELMSRVKALLRRSKVKEESILSYKNIRIYQDRRECFVGEEKIELTFKEYELLRMFLLHIGIVLTRDLIMESVWNQEFAGETRTVDMHIKTLRKKLLESGNYIMTVRNVGYKLE